MCCVSNRREFGVVEGNFESRSWNTLSSCYHKLVSTKHAPHRVSCTDGSIEYGGRNEPSVHSSSGDVEVMSTMDSLEVLLLPTEPIM